MSESKSILFICLGNICRSPMAEAILAHTLKDTSHKVDSCGTASYHRGESPDNRTVSTLWKNGIKTEHKARQLKQSDFEKFDYLLCMDNNNLRNIKDMARRWGVSKDIVDKKVKMFGEWKPKDNNQFGEVVEDPYYGDITDFKTCFDQCSAFCKEFVSREGLL
ncbi:LMWPc-domain-containing protein [Hanseniaspora valbyensis NRRL Y-1626]|uniref:LMWPc-domain-containing protein n=1 Tax=Hanseniaspora valbyensis NRRL Y-1626 TaxID=766949 RepID=A0A1B7TCB9_9ASCO|nr:LMWPc-domain-containing protein [Hanseniaspora valbyensis NRRL Y-1626]